MRFLQDHSIIRSLQSGKRKSHSTETALLHFADELLKNMDEKRVSVVVLLDRTKAFDSIRHDILLAKLRRIGISSSAFAWFSSYLSGRKQVVRLEILSQRNWSFALEYPRDPFWVLCYSPCTLTICYLFLITANQWDT